ncbi:MAG: hypothetical protein FD123_1621 [Bacteroidetes bacterium]|nr:MAG: hypothetical protein FD123_1621 [Bacteroidota bacterium]
MIFCPGNSYKSVNTGKYRDLTKTAFPGEKEKTRQGGKKWEDPDSTKNGYWIRKNQAGKNEAIEYALRRPRNRR